MGVQVWQPSDAQCAWLSLATPEIATHECVHMHTCVMCVHMHMCVMSVHVMCVYLLLTCHIYMWYV